MSMSGCRAQNRPRMRGTKYLAVPAMLRYAIPEASPLLHFGMSPGVTFPLNFLLGIPLYTSVAVAVLG